MNAWPNNLLKQMAYDIATKETARIPDLEKELARISADLERATHASSRAESYPVGEVSHCPKCWIDGIESTLIQIDSKVERVDVYRCPRCRSEYPMPS